MKTMEELEGSSPMACQPVIASDRYGWDKLQVSQWYSPQQAFIPSSESKYLIGIHCTAYYENYYTIHITPCNESTLCPWGRTSLYFLKIEITPSVIEEIARESGFLTEGHIQLDRKFHVKDTKLLQLGLWMLEELQNGGAKGKIYSDSLSNMLIIAAPFGIFFMNTLLVCSGVLAVQLVTMTMAAYAFARVQFAGKDLLFMLFLVQIMVPPDVLIFSNYQVLNEMGLLDTKLGTMLPYFASSFGVFLLRQSFKQLPKELDEAARVEGASRLHILSRIYVPLSRPIYVSFAIVSVSFHWNDFLWPLIVTNSEDNRLLTVGLAMFAKATESGAQWSDVCAATLIVSAPLMIGFLLFQRQVIGSFMSSGIKG